MSRQAFATAILAAVTTFAVCHPLAQEFLPFEGKNAVREGEGGTKKVVDGVDFWADGEPPVQFKLLGFISDRRHKSGLFGMISMSGLEHDIAKLAKENGGDAVILVKSEAETVGTVGNSYGSAQGSANTVGGTTTGRASGWSAGSAAAVQKQNSKFAVVKYVGKGQTASDAPSATSKGEATPPDASKTPSAPASPSS